MTSPIISQAQALSAVPPRMNRGRHSVAYRHQLPPTRIELLHQRTARWFTDRTRPAHLDLVRARVAKWSAFAVPVAIYLAVALAAIPGVR